MIVLFTDFGVTGPYVGQMKAVLAREAPGVPVIDLMHDAPVFRPRASAYLLAALVDGFPPDAVFLCVVDPGVGGPRAPVVATAGKRRFIGPDNGLFEIVLRRAPTGAVGRIAREPAVLSASFHGRDLFAPVAARLARGDAVDIVAHDGRCPDWPDDLSEVVYVDAYGNAVTGLRAAGIPASAVIDVNGCRIARARTFSDRPAGTLFWYENSFGLVEFAVNQGRADDRLGARTGTAFSVDTGTAGT